ncbi:MAG TPA: hypothetical protein PKK06_01640 [Phycisphaerae bacterium]|nr:hypothetical protein [Phycisphaerae bacterium]HNU44173.1 hypothetical protein [Phycisphaerae bacterium]
MAKSDPARLSIEAMLAARGCPAQVVRASRGYTFVYDGRAVARVRPRGTCWEVAWWSYRDTWEHIGDFGGVFFGTIEEAVAYVLDDPMGIFW